MVSKTHCDPSKPVLLFTYENCNHEWLSAQSAYTKNTKYANAEVTNLE